MRKVAWCTLVKEFRDFICAVFVEALSARLISVPTAASLSVTKKLAAFFQAVAGHYIDDCGSHIPSLSVPRGSERRGSECGTVATVTAALVLGSWHVLHVARCRQLERT